MMKWDNAWRQKALTQREPWDVLIIGGGITGVGVLREAARLGLRALLLEQRDFAWGTSSRSSKLVHGGLRYLKQGDIGLVWDSVRERQLLLKNAPHLVKPLGFIYLQPHGNRANRWLTGAGLSLYDLMATQWSHRYYDAEALQLLIPHLRRDDIDGGFGYEDARTDDARLVFRLIREACSEGAMALNYVAATALRRDEDGQVCGVTARDDISGNTHHIQARTVINATGAQAGNLHPNQAAQHIRPLRGSHLIFPRWRFPLAQAVTFAHPQDGRYIFALPWEGVTLVGTTDLDHDDDLNHEPRISPQEVAYLLGGITARFPALALSLDDVLATFAGVRPVLGTGKANPSDETRDHVIWAENRLVTVTGGKLTTFRLIALDVLRQLEAWLPHMPPLTDDLPALNHIHIERPPQVTQAAWARFCGRYGAEAAQVVTAAHIDDLQPLGDSPYLRAELRYAATMEGVVHLDDLLLRRTRLGLVTARGGADLLPQVRTLAQEALGWSDSRWEEEATRYRQIIDKHYSLPPRHLIPDWRQTAPRVAPAPLKKPAGRLRQRALWFGAAVLLTIWLRRRRPMNR